MLDAWLNDDKSDAGKSESTENSAADKPQTEGEVNEISVDEQDVEMNLPNGSEANSPDESRFSVSGFQHEQERLCGKIGAIQSSIHSIARGN